MIKMKNKKGSICSRSTPSHYSNLPWNVRPLEYQTYHKKKGKISTAAVGSSTQTCGGPRGCPITGPHPLLYHPHTHHSSREPSTLRTAPSALATSSPHYSLPGSPIPSPYIYIYLLSFSLFILFIYLFIILNKSQNYKEKGECPLDMLAHLLCFKNKKELPNWGSPRKHRGRPCNYFPF